MVPPLLSIPDQVTAHDLVRHLRTRVGDIEFGYRIQALLAHTLMRLGAQIVELNPQGHPDIVVSLNGVYPVEVEAAPSIARSHVIKSDDIDSTSGPDRPGYLAVLDCALPLAWIVLPHERLKRRGSGPVHLVTLRAMADTELSSLCTQEFAKLLIDNRERLLNLTFHLLRDRALRLHTL